MGNIELIISLVVFVAAIVGAVLYLRADARANRQESKEETAALKQEWKEDLAAFKADVNAALGRLSVDIEGLAQLVAALETRVGALETRVGALETRVGVLEVKVEALDAKIDTKANELSAQMQRNHRELLIRLAFHHHGDGRYPVSAATDPDPVDAAGEDG